MQKRKVHPHPIVQNELYGDEELLWQGKPNPRHHMRNVQWFGVLFGLAFAGFAVFFITTALSMFNQPSLTGRNFGPPLPFKLFFLLIPLVFIGVGLRQAAEPFLRLIEGKGTTYALTNKRAIIITKTWSKNVRSYYDKNIGSIQTRVNFDGTGDVIFSSRMVSRRVHQGRRAYQRQMRI